MEAVDARRMSYVEYLALERQSDHKHEYVNGEVFAMAGGSREHGRLAMQLAYLFGRALEGRPCAVFSSDVRVRIAATGRATYPDLTIVCGKVEPAPDDDDAIANPTVLVEVLSPTTERSDRGDKWKHYQHIASLREYVLVSSEEPRIEVFRRDERGGWRYEDHTSGAARIDALGASVELDALYRDPTVG